MPNRRLGRLGRPSRKRAADANTPVGETIGDIQTFDLGGLEDLRDRVNRIPIASQCSIAPTSWGATA